MRGKVRRKLYLVLLLIPFSVLFFCGAAKPVSAEEEGKEQFDAQIEELIGALDTSELQKYLSSLSEFKGVSLKERLKNMISGDYVLDYSSLGQAILGQVFEEISILLPAFAVILAISLLCGVLNSSKNGFLHSTMSDIIGFVGFISVGTIVLSCLISVLSVGFASIESMRRQMEIVYPLLLTLMAASGGTVSAAVFRPAVAFMSGGIVELFSSIVLPASVVVIVLAFVGNLSDSVRTEKLGDFFKSLSKWLIGLTLGLFSLFLTIQGMTSAQYDGISLRAVKYIVSGSVPIVGGFLSGGVELVAAGSALIKNALGAFAIFLLVAAVLKPLLLFVAFQLFLRLSAAVTEPIGGKIPAFLSRLATDSGYFIAGLLCVAFLYFLTIVLIVCSSGVIF